MSAYPISRLNVVRQPQYSPTEIGLLELFAPTRNVAGNVHRESRSLHASLWRADAIHRAKNMAQMTASLAVLSDHPSRHWLPATVTAQARGLSRAYEALGADDDQQKLVPCKGLLTEVASRLGHIFGQARQIAVTVSAQSILVTPEVRRALVLLCSELVINALKYGYPTKIGGTISVHLQTNAEHIQLVVEDDGVGSVESYAPGQGSGLVDQLCAVLKAELIRTSGNKGHGFTVLVIMQAAHSQGGII